MYDSLRMIYEGAVCVFCTVNAVQLLSLFTVSLYIKVIKSNIVIIIILLFSSDR